MAFQLGRNDLLGHEHNLMVRSAYASYPVVIGRGVLSQLAARLQEAELNGTLWIISDNNVFPLHGEGLAASLRAAGYRVDHTTVPGNESSKSLATLSGLYDWMIGGGVERRDAVLALGGGVVGDLAGFAAASVLRGIAVVQIPTTLQAMVDAAIGGKTGINHPLGKNLIGAFHPPKLVLTDTDLLDSLPARELRAGWAEVIKHGVIRDADLFEKLEAQSWITAEGRLPEAQREAFVDLLAQAVNVKVTVVNNDERETGERMTLNYGHTLGHALEQASGYGTFLHGEAVAIGMHAAARIAQGMGLFSAELVARQERLLHAFGLPSSFPKDVDMEEIIGLTLRDKKVKGKKVRWILPNAIGSVEIRNDVPNELVESVIRD